jgi:hypothetical protein
MSEAYDGREVVGMDLHWRRSVLVRMTPDGRKLETARITNSPAELRRQITRAGKRVPLQNSSHAVWPAGPRSRSGGSVVLVDHTVDCFSALDRCVKRHDYRRVMVGRSLLAGLVWTVPVVVTGVLAEDRSKVSFAVDQHPVGALGCAVRTHRSA